MSTKDCIELTTEEQQEVTERQLAELEFVQAAYTPSEAWIDETNGCRSVIRLLQLPVVLSNSNHDPVEIKLNLDMPMAYPVHKDAHLLITASLHSCPTNPPSIRKAALNAASSLVHTCESAAHELAEHGEAIWHVFHRADEWAETEWLDILYQHETFSTNAIHGTSNNQLQQHILGRRCIYSHHIIANSKRKDLASLAHTYKLGGYVKIGWPGIIIFEGLETSCQAVVDEIKSWRWQHLSIRVEERRELPDGEDIDSYRQLSNTFVELGEDEMSTLAKYCREAELEHMFLQCLKIDNGNQSASVNNTEAVNSFYAALVHVDHMNDHKGYQKWLKKESDIAGCTLFIRHYTTSKSLRPMIYVGLIGDKGGVKKVLKQWRTSRVDVDSKNKPCLERMMTVLIEAEIPTLSRDALDKVELLSKHLPSKGSSSCSFDEMQRDLQCIFGNVSHVWKGIHSNISK